MVRVQGGAVGEPASYPLIVPSPRPRLLHQAGALPSGNKGDPRARQRRPGWGPAGTDPDRRQDERSAGWARQPQDAGKSPSLQRSLMVPCGDFMGKLRHRGGAEPEWDMCAPHQPQAQTVGLGCLPPSLTSTSPVSGSRPSCQTWTKESSAPESSCGQSREGAGGDGPCQRRASVLELVHRDLGAGGTSPSWGRDRSALSGHARGHSPGGTHLPRQRR